MATETTTPSEATMNESVEKKLEELSIEKIEDAQKEPLKVAETETPKEQDSHEIADSSTDETLKVQEVSNAKEEDAFENAPEAIERETLETVETPEVAEKESSNEQEAYEDKVLASDMVAEENLKKEAFESAEADHEEEFNVAQVREVSIPTVDHRSGAGYESKTEDVPTTVVHETTDGEKPSPCQVPADENASDLVAEEKLKKEASESAEADQEEEVNVAQVREVSIPTVEHRSGAGDESKTKDVPTTVVHETTDGEKPSPRRSGDIFQNVGSKMMQSVQKLKNVIGGKSSNGKSSKSTE